MTAEGEHTARSLQRDTEGLSLKVGSSLLLPSEPLGFYDEATSPAYSSLRTDLKTVFG